MVKSKTRRAFCLQFFFCFILLGLFGVRPTVPREIIDRLENLHSRFDELRSPFMFHLAFRIVQLDSQLILGREKWPRYSSETSESRSKRVLKNFSGLMSRCAKFIFLLLVIFIARKKSQQQRSLDSHCAHDCAKFLNLTEPRTPRQW